MASAAKSMTYQIIKRQRRRGGESIAETCSHITACAYSAAC